METRATRATRATRTTSTPARVLGWVTRIEFSSGYSFVMGVDGQEYFAHARNYSTAQWNELQLQDGVSFEPTESAKGWRATRIRPADGDEGMVINGAKETTGNR